MGRDDEYWVADDATISDMFWCVMAMFTPLILCFVFGWFYSGGWDKILSLVIYRLKAISKLKNVHVRQNRERKQVTNEHFLNTFLIYNESKIYRLNLVHVPWSPMVRTGLTQGKIRQITSIQEEMYDRLSHGLSLFLVYYYSTERRDKDIVITPWWWSF